MLADVKLWMLQDQRRLPVLRTKARVVLMILAKGMSAEVWWVMWDMAVCSAAVKEVSDFSDSMQPAGLFRC
ncbi:unnamed protein product [Ilex paraguariensis]|uniref:Uncharacterized protein n=1 Tax=Ilex paraguariensis TaxID=185542 RepID=A0ABC8U0R9_9AQUA